MLILHRESETLKQEALGPVYLFVFKSVLIILIIKFRVWIYYYYIDNNSIELLLEVQYYYIVSLMCHQAKLTDKNASSKKWKIQKFVWKFRGSGQMLT